LENQKLKSRVFISCGQSAEAGELQIARDIAKRLEALDFYPYVALSEQTLRGVKENIFARLSESEYFLFIDFKRDQLENGECRGSLFSHQELAIAAYLNKEVISFQEKGVRRLDGIIAFLQTNSIEFTARDQLPELVVQEVSARWQSNWRDQLQITRVAGQHSNARHLHPQFQQGRPVRYFHLEVVNDHHSKTAFNCYGYLEQIKNITTGKVINFDLVEYKWRGVTFQNVIIPYGNSRELDAFYVYNDQPSQLRLGSFSDSPDHIHVLSQPGDYELTFGVHSENFGYTNSIFLLHVGGNGVDDITFTAKT
jgi:hypothetical protein